MFGYDPPYLALDWNKQDRCSQSRWFTCDHDWVIDSSDWDCPVEFEMVVCSKCQCPGERHIESGEVEWPTT